MLVVGAPARVVLSPHAATLHVDVSLPILVLPFRTSSTGSWFANLSIPNSPGLAGVVTALQAAVGPTANPPLGVDLTNGLLLVPY
jgi:hypothetical protein